MQVLVLAWSAAATGLPSRVAALAAALAEAGHDVRVVTRLGEDGPPSVPGVEVHATGDAPPIVPPALDTPVLDALGAAARTMAVAVRRVEERPVDVVHAVGWATGPVAAALRTTHHVRLVAELTPAELAASGPPGEIARQLADDADVVVTTGNPSAPPWPAPLDVRGLPLGTVPPPRVPGPPPARGPLTLVVPDGTDHRRFAAEVRHHLAAPRRVSASWGRRPFVAALLADEPTALARALELGVPVLVGEGAVADLAHEIGAAVRVDPTPAGVAAAVDRLAGDRAEAAALGAAAAAAATANAWPAAVAAWEDAVATVARQRLHAAG